MYFFLNQIQLYFLTNLISLPSTKGCFRKFVPGNLRIYSAYSNWIENTIAVMKCIVEK